jgi:hypothetical protein
MFNLKTDTIIILQIFVILLLILLIKDKVEGYKVEGFADTSAFIEFKKSDDTVIFSLNTNDLDDETYTKFTKDDMTPSDITGNFFNYEILKKIKPSLNPDDINKIEVTSYIDSNYYIIFYKGRNFDGNSYASLISTSDQISIERYDLPFHPFSFKIFNDSNNMNAELQREANDYNQILLFNSINCYGEIIRLPVKLTPDGTTIALDSFTSTHNNIIKSIMFPGDKNNNDDNNDFRNIELKFIKLLTEEEEEEELQTIKQSTDNLSIDIYIDIDKPHYKITPQVSTLETKLAQNIIDENKKQLNNLKNIINKDLRDYVDDTKYTKNKDDFMKIMSINIVDDMQKKINGFHYDLSNYKLYPI